jgi:hypothetical protein
MCVSGTSKMRRAPLLPGYCPSPLLGTGDRLDLGTASSTTAGPGPGPVAMARLERGRGKKIGDIRARVVGGSAAKKGPGPDFFV